MRLDIFCRHRFSDDFTLDIDVSMDMNALALFGSSGSGKTSIFSAVTGILKPDAGKIAIDQQIVLDTDKAVSIPPERRSVGVTPQHLLLFEHKNVRSNLEFGMPSHRKWKRDSLLVSQREIKFDDVINVLELKTLLNRYPANLSGGEKQRVALGRALLSQPRLLLLDEPLSALDQSLKDRILVYLKKAINSWHIPTIISTHSRSVVYELADSVAIIDAGRIINIGSPEQLLPKPKIYSQNLND